MNTWAFMHDLEVFEKPMEFMPERYVKDGKLNTGVRDPESAAFGYGRRICPGRRLSNDAIFILAASMLAAFNITPPKDESGNPIEMCSTLPRMSFQVAKEHVKIEQRYGKEGR
ncbi:hypothetical protein H1R20_g2705, partial [Candolleomyces eurysporus]